MKTLQLSRLWNASVAGAQRIKQNETELCWTKQQLNGLNTQFQEIIHPPHQSEGPDVPWSLFSAAAKTPACNVRSTDLWRWPYLHQNTVSMITPHSDVRKTTFTVVINLETRQRGPFYYSQPVCAHTPQIRSATETYDSLLIRNSTLGLNANKHSAHSTRSAASQSHSAPSEIVFFSSIKQKRLGHEPAVTQQTLPENTKINK